MTLHVISQWLPSIIWWGALAANLCCIVEHNIRLVRFRRRLRALNTASDTARQFLEHVMVLDHLLTMLCIAAAKDAHSHAWRVWAKVMGTIRIEVYGTREMPEEVSDDDDA